MVLVSLEILPVHWHCQEMHGPAADGISANVQLANIVRKANNYTNIDGINHNNTVRLIKSLQMNVEKTVFADKLKVAVYWCIMQSSNWKGMFCKSALYTLLPRCMPIGHDCWLFIVQ